MKYLQREFSACTLGGKVNFKRRKTGTCECFPCSSVHPAVYPAVVQGPVIKETDHPEGPGRGLLGLMEMAICLRQGFSEHPSWEDH